MVAQSPYGHLLGHLQQWNVKVSFYFPLSMLFLDSFRLSMRGKIFCLRSILCKMFFYHVGCRAKFHRDHVTLGGGDGVTPCKVHYDPTTAKEMLLMAATYEEQQLWVGRLLKRIQKSGFKATSATEGGTRVSPQESIRSLYKPSSVQAHKSVTLPGNLAPPSSSKK